MIMILWQNGAFELYQLYFCIVLFHCNFLPGPRLFHYLIAFCNPSFQKLLVEKNPLSRIDTQVKMMNTFELCLVEKILEFVFNLKA